MEPFARSVAGERFLDELYKRLTATLGVEDFSEQPGHRILHQHVRVAQLS